MYRLPELPYDYAALEPYLSAELLQQHHDVLVVVLVRPDLVLGDGRLQQGEGEVARRVAARYPGATLATLDLPDDRLAANVFGDAGQLPFPDGTFDLVLAVEVLEHLPDPARALDELARVARPGATAVLSVPSEPLWRALNLARGKYVGELGNTPGHIQHWTPRSFRRLVSRRFEVRAVRRPVPWTVLAAVRPGR